MSDYSFGDSARAAERLARLARNFEPASRAFLEREAPRGCARAIDLGCGPGFTTRLLWQICTPRELLGLDASSAYVTQAEANAPPGVTHLVHDVTSLPFPGGPADLIHARMLVSHLSDPEGSIARWQGALRPGGRLLLDEVEWIRTADAAFQRYLELVAQLLRSKGQDLYIGPRIEKATRSARRIACAVRELCLPAALAAGMFSPNLVELRQQVAVRQQQRGSDLDALAAALRAREGGAIGGAVTWGMRQLAIEV